jgi:casein kinase II subunit beta
MDAGIKKFKIELDVQRAMLLMLGRSAPVKSDHSADTPTVDRIARELYGMFHAKYILTNAGLRAMRDKFLRCAYGTCPRVCCNRFPLLPLGLDDAPAVSKMQCFCASCRDIYEPPKPSQRSIDGAVFGTSFPHYFLHRNVDLAPTRPNQSYVPRMFGFRISPRAAELVKYRNE